MFGIVINADMLRDMYTVQYTSGDEEDVTGDELREIMCEKATPDTIEEIMSIKNISTEKLVILSSVGKKPSELTRWLSGEFSKDDNENKDIERALNKWYRSCSMTSRRNPKGKIRTTTRGQSKSYNSVSTNVFYGRFWPEYDDDEDGFSIVYEHLAKCFQQQKFEKRVREEEPATFREARERVANLVKERMKELNYSMEKLASVCRLRGLKSLTLWFEGKNLHHRTVQEAGRAVVAWYEGESVESKDWHHRHISCVKCGVIMNSSLRCGMKTKWCVDCVMLTANRASDVARIRTSMSVLNLDVSSLAKEIGGSARPLNFWLSGEDLQSPRVQKIGKLVLAWFETMASNAKRHKNHSRAKFIEFANQRAAAARANEMFNIMGIHDDAMKAKICDTTDVEAFKKWLFADTAAEDEQIRKRCREFCKKVRTFYFNSVYPKKRRWSTSPPDLFGLTSSIVKQYMEETSMSILELAEKCELSNMIALQWWLDDVELHLESVGKSGMLS